MVEGQGRLMASVGEGVYKKLGLGSVKDESILGNIETLQVLGEMGLDRMLLV